jgi:hypothetical protein
MAQRPALTADLAAGVVSGLAGTAVMTAFQKLVEMPLTGRPDSYAPAQFAERILPIGPSAGRARDALNYVVHFGLGIGWGAAYGVAAHRGLRGQRAVAAVFGAVYTADVALNTALGLYKPWTWSLTDTVVDVVDKLVQTEATAAAFGPVRQALGAGRG